MEKSFCNRRNLGVMGQTRQAKLKKFAHLATTGSVRGMLRLFFGGALEQDQTITYQKAGVDPGKAAKILSEFGQFVKTRPRDPLLDSAIGPYASSYLLGPKLKSYEDPVLVSCCDGVGTKAKLALDWGDISGLGQDLVAMNVNDLICVGADPMLFLDYFACGKLEREQLMAILKGIQLACEACGSSLAGGETAEMPGVYSNDDFDLAGFAIGLAERADCLGPAKVKVGDTILAIASSGVHSNGYSLVRKIVEKSGIRPDDRTSFDSGVTWREALLKPTHLYVEPLKSLKKHLHALAHITGGGLFENLPRVLPKGVAAHIDRKSWKFPPLFLWMQKQAGLSDKEMWDTFNCGVGMIAISPAENANKIESTVESHGISVWKIGEIKANSGADCIVIE
jgi:phosphoribosylformylglycinamidine cyclo-ligase